MSGGLGDGIRPRSGRRYGSMRDGLTAQADAVGRLEVRGKTVFDTYWNNPALTQEAIRDGWFFTGDVARFSRDGHLVQLDWEVDVIRSAAGDIYSLLIEEVVHKHPAVYDACVYGARQGTARKRRPPRLPCARGSRLNRRGCRRSSTRCCRRRRSSRSSKSFPGRASRFGITGKTLKRVFREKTEPHAVPEANRPIAAERHDRSPVAPTARPLT